jgi:hypothetical protein
MFERNEEAESKIVKVAKEIIGLTDEDTYKYIMDLIMSDKFRFIREAHEDNVDLHNAKIFH